MLSDSSVIKRPNRNIPEIKILFQAPILFQYLTMVVKNDCKIQAHEKRATIKPKTIRISIKIKRIYSFKVRFSRQLYRCLANNP